MELKKILVESDGLRQIAQRLNSIVTSISSIQETMQRLTSESESVWLGSARDAATDDFAKIEKAAEELKEQLTRRATSIEQVVETYEKTERSALSQVGDLSVTNIF